MDKTPVRNLYFDLDTMLDTRLPIIYLLDKELASDIVNSGAYHTRRKDNFREISYDIFMPLYRNRSKVILELALPTPMLNMIRAHYGDIVETQFKEGDTDKKACIYINIYPYDLGANEIENLRFIISKIIPKAELKFISMSNGELTPDWVYDTIGTLFKYDGLEWLEYHVGNGNLINRPLLNTHLFTAGIVTGSIPTKKINAEVYDGMISIAQTVIDLTLLHLNDFSFVQEKNVT